MKNKKLENFRYIRQGFKKKLKKLVEFSTKGGGSGWVDFPLRKEKKKKNAKMIRMV